MNDSKSKNMSLAQSFIEKNKKKLWKIAKSSGRYNEKGQCLITKEDEDFSHAEWEDDDK